MADRPVPATGRFCQLNSRNASAFHLLVSLPPGRSPCTYEL